MNEPSHRPATALIAYASAVALERPADQETLRALIRAVVHDASERAALLNAIKKAVKPEAPVILADQFALHASQMRRLEQEQRDGDDILGAWGQRLMAGALIAFVVGGLTDQIDGGVAISASLIVLGLGALISAARHKNRTSANTLAEEAEASDSLSKHVLECGKLS